MALYKFFLIWFDFFCSDYSRQSYLILSPLNAAVHLIFSLRRFDHITDTLICLCWLHVPKHIQYKILFSLIKFFTVQLYVIWEHKRRLRTLLVFITYEPFAPHQITTWPFHLRPSVTGTSPLRLRGPVTVFLKGGISAPSLECFKQQLKTFVFSHSFLYCLFSLLMDWLVDTSPVSKLSACIIWCFTVAFVQRKVDTCIVLQEHAIAA